MPRPFYLLLAVQFVSTLADNAFLILVIARVIELAAQDWVIPTLKLSFTVFYVVLAPFVGPLADAFPKGRVMLTANFIKVGAVILLLTGVDPTVAIGLAGLGAAIYAPAKYGLITELLPSSVLVRANGFFEGTTVCGVIIGTALGGFLISSLMPHFTAPTGIAALDTASTTLIPGMLALLGLNLLATLLSLGIADSGARYPAHAIHPGRLVRRFMQENRTLWQDPLGGLSMAVTTLLWGVGATLQLIVLRWGHESLGLTLAQAAYLQGVTAVGVIAGAMLASHHMTLAKARSLLPLGVAIGLLTPVMLGIDSAAWAGVFLVLMGALAGYFVVPMNALLQHRGCRLLTAGRSIAVQGFNENAGMLLLLALYALAVASEMSLQSLIWCFAALITLGMSAILLRQHRMRQ
jgi:MFS family permease